MDQLLKFSTLVFGQFDTQMLSHAAHYTTIGGNSETMPNEALVLCTWFL